MRSVKNRFHSASENVIWFSASSWTRRFATRSASEVIGRYSYACDCSSRINVPLQFRLRLVGRLAARIGTNSATTVLSGLTAIASYRRGGRLAHAAASSNVSSRSR